MPKYHRVRVGECLSSIAEMYGFFPGTLWDHPKNAALKDLRGNPNVLLPDQDDVFIPEKNTSESECETNRSHVFRRRGVPEVLKLRLRWPDGEPRKQLKYRVEIEGRRTEGITSDEGEVNVWIAPGALHGSLVLDPDGQREVIPLSLGTLAPVSTQAGQWKRLSNLRFVRESEAKQVDLASVLRRFQERCGLQVSGEADEATQSALVAMHGS